MDVANRGGVTLFARRGAAIFVVAAARGEPKGRAAPDEARGT